jgi:nucleoside-diphosphate-sugar epimerase
MAMKILITGHQGFVGRHFVKTLESKRNYTITGVDLKEGQDCRDFFKQDTTAKKYWDLVIHLAAIVGGRQTIENDPIAVATDLSIDAEFFNWAVRHQPRKIVYYSSSAAYPTDLQTKDQHGRKLKESDIDLSQVSNPDFTYGWAKLTGELLAQHAMDQYGLSISVFRPFSGYGEDQDLTYPFPSFIERAKNKANPFQIWGDGHQVRDFIHIDDVVAGTMAAVKDGIPGPINLGWGQPTSFNELATLVSQQKGYIPTFLHQTDQPVGVYYRVADNQKMLAFYQPKITLEQGIARALNV